MKIFALLTLLLANGIGFAQPALKAIEDKNLPLNERYATMKSGSQTFQNYKVIKETILDGVWKITMDSINGIKQQYASTKSEIKKLNTEIAQLNVEIKNHQESSSEIAFDSTHITVLGIPFSKTVFLLVVAALIGGLVFLIVGLSARLKMMVSQVKEKSLIVNSLTNEFDEYKKKSMEKQTKLSRELQNERNKLLELGRS